MSTHADAPRHGARIAIALGVVAVALGYAALITLGTWLATRPGPMLDPESVRERVAQVDNRKAAPIDPLPVVPAATGTELAMARDPMR